MVRRAAAQRPRDAEPAEAALWRALQDVKDPEIPALSVVELGIVRAVHVHEGGARVDLSPTFAGCPAYTAMADAVRERLAALGLEPVEVRRALSPAWSTDDITDEGRRKLRAFGIAPPGVHGGLLEIELEAPVPCPRCGGLDTALRNSFGSTLCREIRTCRACQETFERFKPL